MPYNFAPASIEETLVYGSARPGYWLRRVGLQPVHDWLRFMQRQGIARVCCLLAEKQLAYYDKDLLESYRQVFGRERVCRAPVQDYHLVARSLLQESILPFLDEASACREKVVIHCAAGIGRTGHILAAWLVHGRAFSPQEALAAVSSPPGSQRNPLEAVQAANASEAELYELLLS